MFINVLGSILFAVTILLFLIFFLQIILYIFKKKHFPKRIFLAAMTGAVLFLGLFIYRTYFFTFQMIDKKYLQEGPGPVTSPTETYTAQAFYEPYGGAAGGVNVWVEITNNHEAQGKTVYYSDAKSVFSLEWVNEDTLSILNNEPGYPDSNRSIELKIGKEIYHESGLACKSFFLKDDYETCFQMSDSLKKRTSSLGEVPQI